ncbi:nuclease [Labedella phragmitis]|uniref:DNA 3'-5' helicase n=2 Tax=Labedella phragmitis TaxID=2498849 RepID=A0A3S3ZDP9_9MICO|nr:nuclease [Labedella phragmitis]
MSAGYSAGQESARQRKLALAHDRAAAEARAAAGRYGAAAVSERRVADGLSRLAGRGYHLLPDRQWPGSRRAQVDLVVVGPGGVFIVDTKWWKDFQVVLGRCFRDQEDVTDDVLRLADLAFGAEAALATVGLAPGEVRPIMVMADRTGIHHSISTVDIVGEGDILRHISRRGTRLTPAQVDAVLAATMLHFPALGSGLQTDSVTAQVPEPVLDSQDFDAPLLDEDEVDSALLEAALAQPIEHWMSFLHPDQAKLVRRSFNGPARIRGSAGTGKTVVGLHRAAYLARSRPGKVLVTTYVRTLPVVLRANFARLAPELVDRVEFSGVHQFARRILDERGIEIRLDPEKAKDAFATAWSTVGRGGPLASLDSNSTYWSEEIEYVIKGRGLSTFDQYAECARPGRRRRLTLDQRREVWRLFVAYTDNLRRLGVADFPDLILFAAASLRKQPLTGYSSVIVEEAQDLSCAMIGMLYSLVGPETDGFTLIGDGQQSIYPGGYTLSEVGLSLQGRGVVMDVNYRNTAQIVDFAQSMVLGDEFTDIEGMQQRADRPTTVTRNGEVPSVVRSTSETIEDETIVSRIRALISRPDVSLGDIGVLTLTTWHVRAVLSALKAARIPTIELEKYDGSFVDAVKVGTVKRAKGLEFKQVLLPRLKSHHLPGAGRHISATQSESTRERAERERRELYVAMTRARDGLWVGVVGTPAPVDRPRPLSR